MVTFPHRSIQEFLAAFYFVLIVCEGNVHQLFDHQNKEHPLKDNPMFLSFCYWFMNSQNGYFDHLQTIAVRNLGGFFFKMWNFDRPQLILEEALKRFSFLSVKHPLHIILLKEILSRCQRLQHLVLSVNHPEEKLLTSGKLRSLKSITIRDICLPTELSEVFDDRVVITIDQGAVQFTAVASRQSGELTKQSVVFRGVEEKVPSCPSVTHVTFENCEDLDLSSALKDGRLGSVTHLNLDNCQYPLSDLIVDPRQSLQHLRVENTDLTDKKLEFLLSNLHNAQSKLQSLCVSRIFLHQESYCQFSVSKKHPVYEQLRYLSVRGMSVELREFSAAIENKQLKELDLSRCSVISGELNVLLGKSFPVLERLTLSKCDLLGLDLKTIALAAAANRLPRLRHLDVSWHFGDLVCLFAFYLSMESAAKSWRYKFERKGRWSGFGREGDHRQP